MKKFWFTVHPDKNGWTKKLILTMKLTIFILFLSLMQVSASVYSQATKFTFKYENKEITEVLRDIEDNSKFRFFYLREQVDVERLVSISAKDATVEQILDELFKGQDISYELMNDFLIVLSKGGNRPITNMFRSSGSMQQQSVSGRVTDTSDQPLPGVSIVIKGTTQGTITDSDGNYTLTNLPGDAVLVFSFVGMRTQEIVAGGRSSINVRMEEETIGIEEVVAVGYGTKEKGMLTGSVANIGGESLSPSRTSDLRKSLQGIMPGLIIADRGGLPGSESVEILIRGTHTLGNNAPLYVIDGVPRSGFGELAPDDIEEISVLKDASAAIYGARAANGVIIVRTKRGKTGQFELRLNSNYGLNTYTRFPKMMDSWQYATYQNEASARLGKSLQYSDEDIQKFKSGSDPITHPNTDWFKETFRKWAPETQHNLSATGGTDNIKYFISGDYLRKENLYKSGDGEYNQYQLRSNIDGQVHKYLNIGMDINLRLQEDVTPAYSVSNIMHRIYFNWPTETAYYPNGLPYYTHEGGGNPVVLNSFDIGYFEDIDKIIQTKLSFNLDMDWITKGLALNGYGAVDYWITNRTEHMKPVPLYVYNTTTGEYDMMMGTVPSSGNTSLLKRNNVSRGDLYHIRLAYDNNFGDHRISAFAAYEQSESEYEYFYAYRKNLFSTSKLELFAGEEDGRIVDGSSSVGGRVNYFGYFSYDYLRKYMVDFTIRHDGSFNFPEDKRFGTFIGISAGWNISKEPFMSGLSGVVDNLKPRISYGEMGNDAVSAYQYLTKYLMGGSYYYVFGEELSKHTGMYIGSIPNPNITWEVAKTLNAGFDAVFWKKLTMNFDYFYEKRRGILIQRSESVPGYTAITLPSENLGKVDNSGVEAVLSYASEAGDLNYNIGGNFAFNKSKIVYMDEPKDVPEHQKKEGFPVNSILAYQDIGVFRDLDELEKYPHLPGAQPGDLIYVDVNKDGVINDADRVRHHTSHTPEIQFGLNGGLQFRGFDLFVLFQGQTNATTVLRFNNMGSKPEYIFNQRWTAENKDSRHPRAWDGYDSYNRTSSYHMRNASYIRLKNLELGYNLASAKWISDNLFKRCRIYVSGRNLWTLDHIKYFDPEVPYDPNEEQRGSRGKYYFQTVTFNMGLNITL